MTPKTFADIEKAVEAILLKRIKNIGDNEQLYVGYPAQLIEELCAVFRTAIQQAFEAVMPEKITDKALLEMQDKHPIENPILAQISYNQALSDLQENMKKFFNENHPHQK